MNSPILRNIKDYDCAVSIDAALFVIAIDQIPPHIGLIVDNKYFSFSARGTIVELALDRQVTKINRLKLASVIIDLDLEMDIEYVKTSFESLSYTCVNQSCFLPILDIFKKYLTLPLGCKFLFDFIPYIYSVDKVKNVYQLNANHIITNNKTIPLLRYGQDEINIAIDKSKKYVKV